MQYWNKAILLIDMDAFFAAIEQQQRPELRGKPLAVTNGQRGSCIITSSYEARRYGIETGMRIYEARGLCPHLIQVPSRPELYAQISRRVMNALYEAVTPDIEVYSVDEAFLDVTHCQILHGSPEVIARKAHAVVREAVGLPCSIGVSGDRTTAKYAAKRAKPNGVVAVPPSQAKRLLAPVPVQAICGIAKGTGRFLAQYGAYTCDDVAKMPMGVLSKRFGPIGRRIWLMCRGEDPEPVHVNMAPPKSMGHGKVLPPDTRSQQTVLTYLLHMAEKLGRRLRKRAMYARQFVVTFKTEQARIGDKTASALPTQDGGLIYELACEVLNKVWRGEGLFQLQITAIDPAAHYQHQLVFPGLRGDRNQLESLVDQVVNRFGQAALMPGRLLNRSSMPTALPPSWAQSEGFQCGRDNHNG